MRAQHASNEKARRKAPANGKPKREKKESPYKWAALVWWQVQGSESWLCDASLTTSEELAQALVSILRRRAGNRTHITEGTFNYRVLRCEELLGVLLRGTAGEIHPSIGLVMTEGRRKDFLQRLAAMQVWLPLARDSKVNLHYETWIQQGKPSSDKRRGGGKE